MKIAEVETFVVGNPPPSFGGAYFVFAKLVTDDGLVGYGEAYGATFRPHVVAAGIEDLADQFLVGTDPHHVELFWRRAYSRGFTQRPDVTLQGAMSALEIACWDIIGKAAGKPCYELLGGRVHESLRSYTYLYPKRGRSGSRLLRRRDGRRACRRGGRPRLHRRQVRSGRPVHGDGRAPATAGRHRAFGRPSSAPFARRSAAERTCWWAHTGSSRQAGRCASPTTSPRTTRCGSRSRYRPTTWRRWPRWRRSRRYRLPRASGLTTKYEFARVLEARAAAIVQPDLGRAGGLLEGKKIASLAEAFGAQIAPHCYHGPIGLAANIQLAACSPNFLILECIQDVSGFHAELLRRPITWENGRVIPSTEPGLGVELDEDVARAHPYTGDQTHISMWNDPLDETDAVKRSSNARNEGRT